jgi:hypothetical protein
VNIKSEEAGEDTEPAWIFCAEVHHWISRIAS